MWVLTVLTETSSDRAISGRVRFVGRNRSTRNSLGLSASGGDRRFLLRRIGRPRAGDTSRRADDGRGTRDTRLGFLSGVRGCERAWRLDPCRKDPGCPSPRVCRGWRPAARRRSLHPARAPRNPRKERSVPPPCNWWGSIHPRPWGHAESAGGAPARFPPRSWSATLLPCRFHRYVGAGAS